MHVPALAPTQSLSPDYLSDLVTARSTIFSSLSPKEVEGHVVSGPTLATLIRMLSRAANSGFFPNASR